jgi:ABC-2 type transport system permease protein
VSSIAPRVSVPRLAHTGRLTQARVARSEWTKLFSLRSTRWSLLATVVLTIGLPALFAAVTASHWSTMNPAERADRHPLEIALAGVNLSQLAIAVLGVLVITGEYSTGMIRASFTAVPRRLPVLWAKLGVFAVVTLVLAVPSVLVAFFVSQAILRHHGILQTSLTAHGVARDVVGGALYLMLVGAFALAIGAVIRNTAGGISLFAGLFFIAPPLMLLLPASWQRAITPYLPSEAGRAMFSGLTRSSDMLTPGTGLAVMLGYVALAVAVAAVLLVRRDT